MTGTRLRWAASAALAVVAIILATAMLLDRGRAPAASVDSDPPAASAAPSASAASSPASEPTADQPSKASASDPPADQASRAATSAPATEPASGRSSDPGGAPVDPDAGPPLRPDATLGLSVASAEALARFYLGQAVNYLKLTGDGAAVRAVSSELCTPCREEISVFVETNGRNKRLSGDYLWKNLQVRAVRSTGPRSAVVDLDATRGRHTAIETPGARPKSYPGGKTALVLTLVAEGNNWTIFDLGLR